MGPTQRPWWRIPLASFVSVCPNFYRAENSLSSLWRFNQKSKGFSRVLQSWKIFEQKIKWIRRLKSDTLHNLQYKDVFDKLNYKIKK